MTTRIRVLIVDDQTLVREGFRKLLEFEPDFEVVGTARDGEAAITAVEQLQEAGTPPDVILMDLDLPVVDGWEASRQLKSNPQTRHIPIIALTAHAMSGSREKALAAGCDEFDTKPVDFDRLLGKINSVLARNSAGP